jgi:DNA polymerase-3 subunit epsilon
MREIVLDTETTGLDPGQGHRVIEVGCVELLNHVPTGRTFHRYVNPERPVPSEAFAVHGLSDAFLRDKPPFAAIADEFLVFLGDSPLVIHNAAFDLGFLNAEFDRLQRQPLPPGRAIDTVALARQAFPGAPANLDALCKRFRIDTADRATHGALKDAKLLAMVYLELRGGRQPGLHLVSSRSAAREQTAVQTRTQRLVAPTAEEQVAHDALVARLPNALWRTPG